MLSGLPFLASVSSESTFASGGSSWWQTLGGLLVVFGLLLLSLKLLGKWNRRQGSSEARVLTVWALGPKREIQVLRLGDEVHFIYRHDNAMVLLKQEPLAEYEAKLQDVGPQDSVQGLKRFFPNGLPFSRLAAKPAAGAPDLTSL